MTISDWFSLSALALSLFALVHSILNGQAQAKIMVAERRNKLRLDVHEQALRLSSFIREALQTKHESQSSHVLNKLTRAADGLVSIYQTLDKKEDIPWGRRTYAAMEYESIASKMHEFAKVLDQAIEALAKEDWSELESIADGLVARVWGGESKSA